MAASITDKISDTRNAARPNSARATGTRAAIGNSLACDNLSGWPTASKVHFVTYTVDSSSNPVAGTQLDCSGIVSGNSITSFTVIDGTDLGNAVGDYVEMLPTAAWGQDLSDALTSTHNRSGGLKSGITIPSPIITTPTIADYTSATHTHASLAQGGTLTHTAFPTGPAVQIVSSLSSAVATGTTLLPNDDTIPQSTEGDQYMTLAITPLSATNLLVIQINALLSDGNATQVISGALFQDSTASALAATAVFTDASTGIPRILSLHHTMTAGTTSSTTFKFRAGPHQATTVTFNGVAGGRMFGAIPKSSIIITEYKA